MRGTELCLVEAGREFAFATGVTVWLSGFLFPHILGRLQDYEAPADQVKDQRDYIFHVLRVLPASVSLIHYHQYLAARVRSDCQIVQNNDIGSFVSSAADHKQRGNFTHQITPCVVDAWNALKYK